MTAELKSLSASLTAPKLPDNLFAVTDIDACLLYTSKEVLDEVLPTGKTLGETLLTPTKIYVKPILELISKKNVKACLLYTS